MSPSGVQFDTAARLPYFQPTLSQYLQRLEQALNKRNLAAAQDAFNNLENVALSLSPSSTVNTANEPPARLVSNLQGLGKALQNGDLTEASEALDVVRRHLATIAPAQPNKAEPSHEGSSAHDEPTANSVSEQSPRVNLTT